MTKHLKKMLLLILLFAAIIGFFFSTLSYQSDRTETMEWHSGAIPFQPTNLLFLALFIFSLTFLIREFRRVK